VRHVFGALAGIAIVVLGGCGSHQSQPQSTTVYVPDPAGPTGAPPAPVTQTEVPASSVQPVLDAPPNSPSINVAKVVWDSFQAYLEKVGRVGDGYFAITEDGTGGGSWACGEALCQGNFDGQAAAMQQCATANPGKSCVLFARDNRIKMNYQIGQ